MDISQITDQLFVGSKPDIADVEALVARQIRLIISMIGVYKPEPVFAKPPFQLLWLRAYDTWITPIPMQRLVRGVRTALPIIQKGQRVFVHCAQGRHRSVIMAAAILIASGATAEGAIQRLKAGRTIADPDAWHVRRQIYRFEEYWRDRKTEPQRYHHTWYDRYHDVVGAALTRGAPTWFAVERFVHGWRGHPDSADG
jgi:dual specificity MAP kinase phosphatase